MMVWVLYLIRFVFGKSFIKMNFTFLSKLVSAANVLRILGATVGSGARISSDIRVYNFDGRFCRNLTIGANVFIGPGCLFDLNSKVTIEDDVSVGPQVAFITHLDVGRQPLQSLIPKREGDITVRRGAWIGVNTTVLHGVTIGEFAMVGAMSLVNRDIPQKTLSVGIPCRLVRQFSLPDLIGSGDNITS